MVEQRPILNKIPTTLSMYRLVYGLGQIASISGCLPEERSWKEAGRTAGAAFTDLIDGPLSRVLGSTKHGPTIDRLADMSFSVGGEVALALNDEISPIHPLLSLGREAIVQTLRISAEKQNRTIPVGRRGRQKTALKMATISSARSPLSKKPDLIESMASFGTALSLLSGIEYVQQYYSGNNEAGRHDTSRNGQSRKISTSPNARIVQWIDDKFPGIKPDHLTLLGEGLVESSLLLALLKPELSVPIAAGPNALGGVIDGWDGNLARLKELNTLKGMLRDVRADKRQEILTAATNCLLANTRGNKVAATHYALGAMTSTLPAFFRAMAESKGYIVSEDASGSRVTRGIEGGVGLGLHRRRGIANTISALMVAGNVITAAQRFEVARSGNFSAHYRGSNNDPEFLYLASERKEALKPFVIGGAVIGAGLLYFVHFAQKDFYQVGQALS